MLAPRRVVLLGCVAPLLAATAGARAGRGFNLIQAEAAPFGSEEAAAAMRALRRLGADTVAIVVFLWQPAPDSAAIVRGSDMTDAQLAAGIAQARRLGMRVMVKLHVWVPGTWAGAVRMPDAAAWQRWFAGYAPAMLRIAAVAGQAGAGALCLGTELLHSSGHEAWRGMIAQARRVFGGELLYTAHNAEEAERVPFWDALDAIGVSLYPALGADDAPAAWRAAMEGEAMRLDRLSSAMRRPVWVTEFGLRSARGAAARPWESAEEREAEPDDLLQSRVLETWLDVLDRPSVEGRLVWRWLSDPRAGGARDTDFTVQGKRAEEMLLRRWAGR